MTRIFATAIAAVLAISIGATTFAAPAQAGQFSFNYTPSNAEDAKVLGMGLQMYSMVKGLSSGANIRQSGSGNAAGIGQYGTNNNGLIVQKGRGHNGSIEQSGNSNTCALFQYGRNTNGHCRQTGNGQSSLTGIFGF